MFCKKWPRTGGIKVAGSTTQNKNSFRRQAQICYLFGFHAFYEQSIEKQFYQIIEYEKKLIEITTIQE